MSLWHSIEQRLTARQNSELTRYRQAVSPLPAGKMLHQGKEYINFSSNDYLGLSTHADIQRAVIQSQQIFASGSGASQLVTGHHPAHHELEQAIAEFTGFERALFFSCGYMANMALVTSLLQKNDVLLMDKRAHASLIDAGKLSNATLRRFPHNQIDTLENWLSRYQQNNVLVASEGVFSMLGDQAPLNELAKLTQQYSTGLFVDDAHGFGVLGQQGIGSIEHAGLNSKDIPIMMATFGKAGGVYGAFIASNATVIESMIEFARPFIYSTALPPAIANACLTSLRSIQQESWRRGHLKELIQVCQVYSKQLNLPLLQSDTAIQPLLIGDADKAMSLAKKLKRHGFWLTAMRPPTVPAHQTCLRISLTAAHTHDDVIQLLTMIAEYLTQKEQENHVN